MSSGPDVPKQANASRSGLQKAVVALGALLSALGTIEGLLKQFSKALGDFRETFKGLKGATDAFGFPGPVSWAVVAALLSLGFLLIWVGSIKRSKLLRPEALALRADDPSCLKGRDDDLAKLVALCQDRSLVFLVGESGAGKSAIVRAGLCQPGKLPSTIVPVLLDGWGEDWSEGLGRRLAVALRMSTSLTEEEWGKLELAPGAKLPGLLAAIRRFRSKLGRSPLLIFDQFDDCQIRHRGRFRDDPTGTWKPAARIESENPFWKGIADLVREENAHVLIVTRSDTASGLSSVSFAPDPPYYPLDPPSVAVVRPLLNHLTRADHPDGPVVADPGDGWETLKGRLAEDLERDGQVLPIQLRTALAGLAGLRSLTVADYRRAGGVRGLETKAVQTMIAGAARHSGLRPEQVILVLKALVDERDRKTVARTVAELDTIGEAKAEPLKKSLDFLKSKDLVRPIPTADDGTIAWQLDHDYWCHAVIEAERRSDRWNVLLRDAHHAWIESHGDLRKRWSTLLWPSQQMMLLWKNLRGRCRFGDARRYWWLSTASFIPYLLVALAGWFLADRYLDQRDEAKARAYFAMIGRQDPVSEAEMKECFWPLVLERREGVRRHFLRIGLESPENAERLERRAALVAQATVGTDGLLRSRVIDDVSAVLRSKAHADGRVPLACAALGKALCVGGKNVDFSKLIVEALVQQLKEEHDPDRISRLANAFESLMLASDDQVKAVVQRLLEAIRKEVDSARLYRLNRAFESLMMVASGDQARAVVPLLVEAIQKENNLSRFDSLAGAFATLAKVATDDQDRAFAKRLVEAISKADNPSKLVRLAGAFAAVENVATGDQARAFAKRLVEAISKEGDPSWLVRLAGAFAAVANVATDDQARAFAKGLVEAISKEDDPYKLGSLAIVFASVVKVATDDQVKAVDKRLVEAISKADNPYKLVSLAGAFATVANVAADDQTSAFARRLLEMIWEENDLNRFASLAVAFVAVAKVATDDQIETVVKRLVEAILKEDNPSRFNRLAGAFAAIVKVATDHQDRAFAKGLVEAISKEDDPSRFGSLAVAFASVATFASDEQVKAVASRLLEAILKEDNPSEFTRLSETFEAVAKVATDDQVKAVASRLLEAILKEGNPYRLQRLAGAFATVAKGASTEQVRAIFQLREFLGRWEGNSYYESSSYYQSSWSMFIRDLPDVLKPSDLADVLNYPNCIGQVRSTVLKRLAGKLDIKTLDENNPWPFYEHEKVKPLLARPLVMPRNWPARN